jgi:hypothetical protein
MKKIQISIFKNVRFGLLNYQLPKRRRYGKSNLKLIDDDAMIRWYYPGTNDQGPLPTNEMTKIFRWESHSTYSTFITIPKHPAPNGNVHNERCRYIFRNNRLYSWTESIFNRITGKPDKINKNCFT